MYRQLVYHTIIVAVFASSFCKEEPSYEPKEVIAKAKESYSAMEVDTFLSFLSLKITNQLEKDVNILRESFAGIPEAARVNIAKSMGVNPKSFPNIKLSEYVLYVMNNEKKGMGSDNVIFPHEVRESNALIGENISDEAATLSYDNGVEVHFIKENGQWKINSFHLGHTAFDDTADEAGQEMQAVEE